MNVPSSRLGALTAAALLVGVGACIDAPPRESQVVLVVRTDAPLPASSDGAAPALFDRLLVEVFAPGNDEPCANCTESFALDAATVAAGLASIGIVVQANAGGRRVRMTLYGSRGMPPRSSSSIVHVHALPVLAEGRLHAAHVTLRVDEIGVPAGSLTAPLPLAEGPGESLSPWPGANEVPCEGAAGEDEACVPGGAFVMGDPGLDSVGTTDQGGRIEHLVVVGPFFVDRHEVTVAELRAANVVRRDDLGQIYDPNLDLGPNTTCTFREEPGQNDALPVTCVSHVVASDYCARHGKRLLTEAEFERVATGLIARRYVWGVDPPACEDAVHGRDNGGRCGPRGPLAPGSGRRDRLTLGGVDVVDLAGNVSEWVQDLWNRDDDPCFPPGVLRNPRCETESPRDGKARLVRGGSFYDDPLDPAAARSLVPTRQAQEGVSDRIGFRCGRSAGP